MSAYEYDSNLWTAKVNDLTTMGGASSKYWTGHSVYTVEIAAGSEATCGTSRIDRTLLSKPQTRYDFSGVWVDVTSGTLYPDPPADIKWCNQPTQYRYYMNSQIHINTCG
jgi:hypothetical protein